MDRWILKRLTYIRQSFSQSISPLSNHSSVSETTCKMVMWLKPSVSLSVKQPISSASCQLASQLVSQLVCQSLSRLVGKWGGEWVSHSFVSQSLSRLVGKWEDEWVSHSFVSQSLSRLVGKWEDEWVSHSFASHSISQSVSQSIYQKKSICNSALHTLTSPIQGGTNNLSSLDQPSLFIALSSSSQSFSWHPLHFWA